MKANRCIGTTLFPKTAIRIDKSNALLPSGSDFQYAGFRFQCNSLLRQRRLLLLLLRNCIPIIFIVLKTGSYSDILGKISQFSNI